MKPNILFIVIDSLRADRIFGRQKIANSPNIDYLIKKGVLDIEARLLFACYNFNKII